MNRRTLGVAVAAATFLLDQASKLWLIHVFEIGERQPVRLAPFFDVVMAWNPGISYSLFPASSAAGRLALLAVTLAATALLAVWLWRATTRLATLGLGLLVGGALGNALDRAIYGAVADFFHFHVGNFSWYVFNLADVAIVAGVGLLLYDGLTQGGGGRAGDGPG
ncbi:MAG: signal peptidase II [Methylobacteriaceae bacterium]|nr:signal peptidase II [Methylobacteriaceae bacterium]